MKQFRSRKRQTTSGPTTPEVAFYTVSQWPNMAWAVSPWKGWPIVESTGLTHLYYFTSSEDFKNYINTLGLELKLSRNYIKKNHYFKVGFKPLPYLFHTQTVKKMTDIDDKEDLTPSEMRELAEAAGIGFVNNIKNQQISEATESEIHEIWLLLAPTSRRIYKAVIADIDKMIKEGMLKPMLEVEKSRIAMLKVGELMGMAELMNSQRSGEGEEMFGAQDNETLQKYIEIGRKLGNESQRMLEVNKKDGGKDDSFFDRLSKLDDVEVTFKKKKVDDKEDDEKIK